MTEPAAAIETDAVIVGAGPVGLFQVFQLGLLEIKAHVVDALAHAGGQCGELYADKPIYDIPGLPVCTGRELIDRLLVQIAPFNAPLHLSQEVARVERGDDGRFLVETGRGLRMIARVVVVASGVGAFRPRTLKLEGLARFDGTQLHHRFEPTMAVAGRQVVIVGDGTAALEAAVHLAESTPHRATAVSLIHRRDSFRAPPALVEHMRALCAAGQMQFVAGQVTGVDEADGRLVSLQIVGSDGAASRLPADHLLVLLGLSPQLGPVADWGLEIERKQVVVDSAKFETRVPGLFAVGDINTYPGKRKLIVCGFHEATLAAYGAAQHVYPERPVQLQYTTTSPRLHRLLGVESPAID